MFNLVNYISDHELNHQIKQKDGYIDEVRKEMDQQLCQLQLENISLNKRKQHLEMEMKRITMDLEKAADASIEERKRLQDEIGGLRSRLDSTQSILTSTRQDALGIAEAKAGLERELNLIRGQCGVPILPNLDYYPSKENTLMENDKFSRGGVNLRDLCDKQTRIIDELKSQCLMATDKLEALAKKYQKEKAQYDYSLAVLMRQQGQNKTLHDLKSSHYSNAATRVADDNTAVIEWLCRQLGNNEY